MNKTFVIFTIGFIQGGIIYSVLNYFINDFRLTWIVFTPILMIVCLIESFFIFPEIK